MIGVAASISSVCFSRSRLIAPAVDIGARKTTSSVSSISSAAKMPWPMAAVANALLPPKPVEYVRSMISSTIQVKPPSSSR